MVATAGQYALVYCIPQIMDTFPRPAEKWRQSQGLPPILQGKFGLSLSWGQKKTGQFSSALLCFLISGRGECPRRRDLLAETTEEEKEEEEEEEKEEEEEEEVEVEEE